MAPPSSSQRWISAEVGSCSCEADPRGLLQKVHQAIYHVALRSWTGRAGAPATVGKRRTWTAHRLTGSLQSPHSHAIATLVSPQRDWAPQYFGRCEPGHFLACSIGGQIRGCPARSRCTVGKASIRSRQACTTGKLAYIVLPSGVRPNEWVLGSK